MANDLIGNASLFYGDQEGTTLDLTIVNKTFSNTLLKSVHAKQSIQLVTEEAIKIGELATLGWAIFVNRSTTGTIHLKRANGDPAFATLKPGEFAMFRFYNTVTAPYAVAEDAVSNLEYLIFESD